MGMHQVVFEVGGAVWESNGFFLENIQLYYLSMLEYNAGGGFVWGRTSTASFCAQSFAMRFLSLLVFLYAKTRLQLTLLILKIFTSNVRRNQYKCKKLSPVYNKLAMCISAEHNFFINVSVFK